MILDGIGKRYRIGGPWVLRDVRLELRPGRVVRVQGQNGSGKSTLLRVIAGIAEPSSGRVSGRPTTGYVPERFPAALPFTAGQYLRHHARMRGVAASQGTEWLERFGAEQFAGTAMKELSKGTSQKIAVTQALLGDPELLVLDEAWTGLDTAARDELSAVVRERAQGGACVVFVDHDPARMGGRTDEWWSVQDSGLVAARGSVGGGGGSVGGAAGGSEAADDPIDAAAARQAIVGGPAAGSTPVSSLIAISATGIADATSLAALLPDAEISAELGGVHRIVVAEARSDQVLRLLLALRPEVHIVAVSPAPAQIRAPEES